MDKLVLIDGNSLIHRAYHAYPELTSPKGVSVGAVYGFSAMLLNVLSKLAPTHVVVAWDVKGVLVRKEKFAEYKANRKPMDESLVNQLETTKKLVESLGIPQFGLTGIEADDLIGTLALTAKEAQDVQVVIVTGDKDSLQLVDGKRVVVYMPIRSKYAKGSAIFDEERVKNEYGLHPKQLIDLKALMGDSSDNFPGVKGVGKITALKLIQTYGSVDGVYQHLSAEKNRLQELLTNGREMAYQCRDLAKIDCEVELNLDWEACKLSNYNKKDASELLLEFGFTSLIDKLPNDEWEKEVDELFGI